MVDIKGESIIASVTSDDITKPQMYLSIAYDELYGDVERMNDLSDDDLAVLEEEVYENLGALLGEDDEDEEDDEEDEDADEDEDDEDGEDVFYSVKCPGCGAELTVDGEILDEGEFECPECGEVIDFDTTEVEEVEFDAEDEDEDEDN